MANSIKKTAKNNKKCKKNDKKIEEEIISQAWKILGLSLDVMESRLLSMMEDAGAADLSKLTQMFGSVFDRLMELRGMCGSEQKVKKIEDFE